MHITNFKLKALPALLSGLTLLTLAACHQAPPEEAPPPAKVTAMTVSAGPVELTEDLPGRVTAFRTAEIRPQVGGIVQRRLFEQGAEVKAGAPLFQIHTAPFQADADTAAAALQRAEAALVRAKLQAERIRPLVQADAVSQQSYDDAVSQRDQAQAEVAQAKATLARRRLDVGYATVTAPISGRIGEELVTEGALVAQTDATPMARVQQIDQVYVDVRQPASMLRTLRGDAAHPPKATILDGNGNSYGLEARILFSGINVDTGTGDMVLRILVPNPDRQLLPGMFVRARIGRMADADGILVPQQAVLHAGSTRVWVLDAAGKAALREVKLGGLVGHSYLITQGLKSGERVAVEGLDRIQPDTKLDISPWKSASATLAKVAAPAAQR
ncbi:efflux RND transporter periplasmic adaptor subunit [Rugamonas aquatica]|uniref:Efflux RND transporter periplasmic adaptor subunit n=1 Tax=Rugamonas aquatica TaxID=2743357 RepID=A0A6A7MUW3_9BURK|nr:efflux RND transporter periplasmic adaptor subunit [Rugamonas aquatica]MQA36743.1 efflux RND transporter periplasmic adaptor subunit [Rugamonas aquatica]